jgi:SpoVK/Ycf46/Vps4 family AAA+-type ATPase
VDISWSDLREAAHACVPSQLAQLDVTKAPTYPSKEDGSPNSLKVHEWSWRNFAGYHDVKKRLYRTVVMPWRRFIAATGRGGVDDNEQVRDSWVTAPSGVLFHGPPGVGKTLAASCLASSLELCAIKVRLLQYLPKGSNETRISLVVLDTSLTPNRLEHPTF